MEQSQEVHEIFGALAKAQAKISAAKKDSVNPAYAKGSTGGRYADLASVWDACREALSENDLSVMQAIESDDGSTVKCTTQLGHKSGQWVRGVLCIRLAKTDAHGVGSAATYARRYALSAMVGVAPDDDDGEAAVGRGEGCGKNGSYPANDHPRDGQKTKMTFWEGEKYTIRGANMDEFVTKVCRAASLSPTSNALGKLWEDNSYDIKGLPAELYKKCEEAFNKRSELFAQNPTGEAA